jgi:hypothetical protein
MGWAVPLGGVFNGIDAFYGLGGCVGGGLGLTWFCCKRGNRVGARTGHPHTKNSR